MAKYETTGCSFTIPDELTVRKQLYYSTTVAWIDVKEILVKRFEAAKVIVEDWESEIIPDINTFNIDEATNTECTRIVVFVANQAWLHMHKLEEIEKN